MIFALIDYAQYRFHTGSYSDAALYAEGWIPATPHNFSGGNEPKPGNYFVMHRRRSTTSWFIMYGTQSRANHAGLFAGNGLVIDALVSGVTQHPLSDYFDGRTYFITNDRTFIRPCMSDSEFIEAKSRHEVQKFKQDHQNDQPHLRLYTDFCLFLGALALPHIWFPWWSLMSLWLIPLYLLKVGFDFRDRFRFWERRTSP